MRYRRFRYRRTTFTSLAQVNQALAECVDRINERRHSRFGVSRRERFEALEKSALKPLPQSEFEGAEWKEATLHPDCYLYLDGGYYSAPHIHRHKRLRAKLTENQVEIFLDLERLAVHPRCRSRNKPPHPDRCALPAGLAGLLRADAAEPVVAVALHPP
jgi:hypothetical protein